MSADAENKKEKNRPRTKRDPKALAQPLLLQLCCVEAATYRNDELLPSDCCPAVRPPDRSNCMAKEERPGFASFTSAGSYSFAWTLLACARAIDSEGRVYADAW